MGLFLGLSGIVGVEEAAVEGALRDYADENDGEFKSESLPADDDNCLILSQDAGGVVVVYPGGFEDWHGASSYLSARLQKPVFGFHIHDGDFWMYILFRNGEEIDQFNPVPDYWNELDDEEREAWRGDGNLVASLVPGLSLESIERYLTWWDESVWESDDPPKAYPDDEFAYGVDWQLLDFVRRLGLSYPVDDQGNARGHTFCFKCRSSS